MGVSLPASFAVLGVTFLLVIQMFSSTINEELVDVGEAYKEMTNRAIEQCQTSINITQIVDAGWRDTNWAYRKMIIINHSQVTEDLTDFPVLICREADADLASEAQSSGSDIMFISDDNTTKYNHEIESYNATTGELTAWVKIPHLSANVDTVLYMYYGNAVCGDQQNVSGTWDENYKMVHHLDETVGTLYDSTSCGNNATNDGAVYNSSAKIDGGYDFTDSGNINCGNDNSLDITNTLTLEAWVKDPPINQVNRKKSRVTIADKRDEQRSIASGESFTIHRTIKTDEATSIVFACLCSPGIEIRDIQRMDQSVFGGSYFSSNDNSILQSNIESVKKTLPYELQRLQRVVYSRPFTVGAGKVPVTVSCRNQEGFDEGQISYLVIAADGCYDFEGTTHWKYSVGPIDWVNPFSVAKTVMDFFSGTPEQKKETNEEKHVIQETTYCNNVVNQPVRWRTNIRFTNKDTEEKTFVREVNIPHYATNISITNARGNTINTTITLNDTSSPDKSYVLSFNTSVDSGETKTFFVRYTTPEPHINETTISPLEKQVVISSDIHYTDVKAYTSIDNRSRGAIHLYHVANGSRREVSFTAIDLDSDTLIDRIEWPVPHLSDQTYEVVIEITKAKHLDKQRRFLSDIYNEVNAKDDIWSEPISHDEYVQVTFAEPLDKTKDITIFARSQGSADIEVYSRDNDSLIATFTQISDEKWYRIVLSALSGRHTTFDLRTKGDAVQYDYLVDPLPDTSVDIISPYLQSSSPLTITATNITPVNNVTLHYRYSTDNSSWDRQSLTQDFNVQRGTCIIPAGSTTVTITNGSSYTLLTDENHAFIRIVNTRLTGMGTTSGGYSNDVEGGDYATRIDNPDNLDTSITFRRAIGDATYDCRVTWELIQYIGPSGEGNEFIVRDVGDVTTASGQTIDGDSNITTIEDINKVCCFITGQAADETTDADWFEFLFVADMRDNGGGGYTPWFWRAKNSATDAYVSYAVVEFVGSNWRDVQRLNISTEASTAWTTTSPDEYTDVTIQSEGGVDLLDVSKAFLHVQYATDNDATGLDDAGDNIEIISTTHLRIRNRATAGNRYKVVWIVENIYNGTGKMEVEHIQFYDATTSGAEERSWTQSITTVDSMSNTSIMGECASMDGAGTAYPRGSIDLRLTDVDEVTSTECDNGQERQITFDVVQWPCSINWNLYVNDTNPDENSPWSWDFTFPNGTGYYEFYSIGKISEEYDENAPNIADARCYYNPAPTQENEGPSNGSTGTETLPLLNVTVDDVDGETLTAHWLSNSSGFWEQFETNNSIDTSGGAVNIKQTNSNFSDWETTYWWSVNITDGSSWSNATYQFTTNFVSKINNPIPANQSSDLNITPLCNITVSDVDGGLVNISFYENTTGAWKLQQTNSSVDVSTPTNVIWGNYNNATSYSATYWWKVNVTDDKGATNESIYHFTTSYPPSLSNPDPENGSLSEPVSTVCSITVSDTDEGNVTVTFYENTTGTWKVQQTNSSVDVSTPAIVIWNNYSNASEFNTKYWWKVNVTDGKGLSSEETYHFTTAMGNPPIQSAENPSDFATNVPITLTTINVTVEELDGESLDWTIDTNPDIGNSSGFNEGNGSKTCSVSGLTYGTTYTWYVNTTDGTDWTNETYIFTTSFQPNMDNPGPNNGSAGQNLTPRCNVTVSDVDGGTVTVSFYENTTGVWKVQQTNISVDVTTPANIVWIKYTNATQRKTTYWWKVNVTDNDGNSRETIYHFTTTKGDPPQIDLVNPSPNGTTNVPILPSCQIQANDSEGDTLTVYWYENSSGSYQLRATYNDNVTANSTTGYVFPQFTNYSITYFWKVVVNDSYYNTTATYIFTTEPIDTSVDGISPYNITWFPLTTTASGGTDLANLTLHYRWSKDNQSWDPGNARIKVQKIIGSLSGSTSKTESIEPVNSLERAFILYEFTGQTSSDDTPAEGMSCAYLSDTGTITIEKSSSAGGTDYSIYVIECLNNEFIVRKRGSISLDTTETSDTDTVSSIKDTSNVFISSSQRSDGTSNDEWYRSYCTVELLDDDTVSANRSASGVNVVVRYEAVEWLIDNVTVQTKEKTLTSLSTTEQTDSIDTAVDTSRSFIYATFRHSSDGLSQTSVRYGLTDSSTISFMRGGGTYDSVARWWIIEFPANSVTVNRGSSSQGAPNDIIDITVPACNVTYSFPISCGSNSGEGNAFPRGRYYSNLSSETNLRLVCGYSGNTQYYAWQVIDTSNWSTDAYNWSVWNNVSNPDTASSWSWDFPFPNGTGYYEFYSIGRKAGSVDENPPDSADTRCFFKLGGHAPTIDLVAPAPNGTTGVNLQPLCQIQANDEDGDTLTVYWYENTTGDWVLRNTNNSIGANSIVNYSLLQFANYSTTYWWKVAVNDTLNNVSAVFSFTTEPLNTSIDTISPYNVNKKPLTITATNVTPVDNVTLWYRYSTVNRSWTTYETGVAENVNEWTSVTLDNTYTNPVVIVTGQDGADRSLGVEKSRPRIRNVGSTSFEVIVTNDTGVTVTEDVGYVVMEEGHWEIDGAEVEAGTYTVSDAGSHVIAFSESFPGETVVVDTIQEDTTVDASSRYVEDSMSSTGYTVYWEGYDDNSNLATVTAGYIAVELGISSSIFESSIEDEVADDPGSGTWRSVSFSNSYSVTPILFTNPIDEGGGDPTIVGRRGLSTSGVDVRCTEGQNQDEEMDHAINDIPWMVWTEATASGINWIEWNDTNNPDTASPWSWDFTFPNGTGYYEFYSTSKKEGSGDEPAPSSADAGCQYLNTAPIATNESPTNESFNISLNAVLSIKVNDSEGHTMNISWYWGINSSCPNFIDTNTSVSNGTYTMQNGNNFSELGQTYYWKVTIMDSYGAWTNETYHFKTTGINKEIISKEKTAYALEISPDGNTLYGIVNNTNVTAPIDTSWHYVVLTYNGSTLSLYIDGELSNTTTLNGNIPINEQDVLLGDRLTGTLDEIRISDTARDASWIETSHAMMNDPTTFIRIEPEQNQNFTYLNITIENIGSTTLKTEEFSLLVNGTEFFFVDLQPYLYPNQEMRVFVNVAAAGSKRNTFITGNGISNCKEYG